MITDAIKIIVPGLVTFIVGILLTPFLTKFLYRHELWKKKSIATSTDGVATPITNKLHNDEARKVPRMGGIVVWGSVLITTVAFWIISHYLAPGTLQRLEFVSRNETWLPLFVLVVMSLVGLIDDYIECVPTGSPWYKEGGLSFWIRIVCVLICSLVLGWWFFAKLGVVAVAIPFFGMYTIGAGIILLYVLVGLGTYSGGIIDGVDGLSGGVFATIFVSFTIIAYSTNQIDIAAFSMAIVGGLLAFLWFNIPPARFFMSETGTMGLTAVIPILAFLTNTPLVVPILCFPLLITALSSIVQIIARKTTGKKIFIAAPLHNHLQAIGWPSYKVTMRYWIFSSACAVMAVIITLIGIPR